MNSCDLNRVVNIPALAVSIVFGTVALYIHNNLLPYVYFLFAVCVIMSHVRLYCTRCAYYGRECYIFGGLLAKGLFKARHKGPLDPEDAILASAWILLALFPVPFLLYYQDVVLAAIYILLFWGWFYAHGVTACANCENIWCGLNKKHKGGK
jgi:hypothetical protein